MNWVKPEFVDYLHQHGIPLPAIERLRIRCEGVLQVPGDIKRVLDSYGYDYDWERDYVVRSAASSSADETLSCINAAVLAYTLLGALPDQARALLAIHRRDPHGVECGHVVALSECQGEIYALGKSNYPQLNRVYGPFPDRYAASTAFGRAYLSMSFTPLYFGFFDPVGFCSPQTLASSPEPLNGLCNYMMSNYQYAFDVERAV